MSFRHYNKPNLADDKGNAGMKNIDGFRFGVELEFKNARLIDMENAINAELAGKDVMDGARADAQHYNHCTSKNWKIITDSTVSDTPDGDCDCDIECDCFSECDERHSDDCTCSCVGECDDITRNCNCEPDDDGDMPDCECECQGCGCEESCGCESYCRNCECTCDCGDDCTYSRGGELVSPILDGERGIAQMRAVMNAARDKLGDDIEIDSNCGAHVHVSWDRMKTRQIREIVRRYAHFEKEIDYMMPESRRNDTYCRPLKHDKTGLSCHFNSTLRIVNSESESFSTLASIQYGREMKLNLRSFASYGTIEFRQHGGTFDADKMESWVRFICGFITACIKHADKAGSKHLPEYPTDVRSHCRNPLLSGNPFAEIRELFAGFDYECEYTDTGLQLTPQRGDEPREPTNLTKSQLFGFYESGIVKRDGMLTRKAKTQKFRGPYLTAEFENLFWAIVPLCKVNRVVKRDNVFQCVDMKTREFLRERQTHFRGIEKAKRLAQARALRKAEREKAERETAEAVKRAFGDMHAADNSIQDAIDTAWERRYSRVILNTWKRRIIECKAAQQDALTRRDKIGARRQRVYMLWNAGDAAGRKDTRIIALHNQMTRRVNALQAEFMRARDETGQAQERMAVWYDVHRAYIRDRWQERRRIRNGEPTPPAELTAPLSLAELRRRMEYAQRVWNEFHIGDAMRLGYGEADARAMSNQYRDLYCRERDMYNARESEIQSQIQLWSQ